ncbi:hypothetical protein AAMO2058_000080800 [Amorphochlora amoebiformis]
MSLSSRIKNMKFMKRKEEARVREKIIKDRNRKRKASQWTSETKTDSTLVILEEDKMYDTRFMLGRRSFGGFNKTIAKINSQASGKYRGKKQTKSAVSDQEMANRYEKFVGMRGENAERYERKKRKGQGSGSRKSPKKTKNSTNSPGRGRPSGKPRFKRPKDLL